MARKKKRSTPGKGEKKVALSREAEDELVSAPSSCGGLPFLWASNDVKAIPCTQDAIEAIFSAPGEDDTEGGPFRRHDDGKGFDLTVVPHPGDAEANVVWANIGIRCAGFKRAASLGRAAKVAAGSYVGCRPFKAPRKTKRQQYIREESPASRTFRNWARSHKVVTIYHDRICRLLGGYPEEACTVRIQDSNGISDSEKHALSKVLHQEAIKHAEQGQVCAFNLVDTCQVGM